ncbi:substrate-binding domain-containing protein [Dactylosporangium sp. NPDC000244]|uniref:substrate-binding domain-containing protein n=1 Tax=Dactylosporangium sp. NPDC000244 TaxID=3154365 RepID=UPI003318C683
MSRSSRGIVVLLALALAVLGTARPAAAADYVPISGGGSTTVYNAFNQWAGNVAQYRLHVNYLRVGDAGGRQRFAAGDTDFAASDVPFDAGDPAAAARPFAYMPDVAVATTFVYTLRNGFTTITNLRLSGENVAKIFTGRLTAWNDPAIAADNPGVNLPAIAIVPVVHSEGSGQTAALTRWMAARQGPIWQSYCTEVGRTPCDPTSAYPVLNGSRMVAQPADQGVAGYVSLANGAIGYTDASSARAWGLPAAKVLNEAGYYTEPTAGHVGVSLLAARVAPDGTADLSGVYTNPDPRTYELAWYSYMLVPTTDAFGFTAAKGFTLSQFGTYLLCPGQGGLSALGLAPLPVNLSLAGYRQLRQVPGAQVPPTEDGFVRSCTANPTIAPDGTDRLAASDPMPAACDRKGQSPCFAAMPTETGLSGPDQVAIGDVVSLLASVNPVGVPGTVRFFDRETPLAAPVPVYGGYARLTTTLDPGLHLVTARYEPPADYPYYQASTSYPLAITVSGVPPQDESIVTNVPHDEGVFTMTVSDTPVRLTTAALRPDHTFDSTGSLAPVTITDDRDQTHPGWSLTGQVGDFTSGANTFSGAYLSWTPAILTPNRAGDVQPGAPSATLRDGSELAHAPAAGGLGTTVLGAGLHLRIPSTTQPGDYSATLTITAIA